MKKKKTTKTSRQLAKVREEILKSRFQSRIRSVDFIRIEQAASTDKLSSFEVEVKGKLASDKTPRTDLLQKEEDENQEMLIEKVYEIAGRIRLTRQQRRCFYLIYQKNYSLRRTARKMKITPGTVQEHVSDMLGKLKEAVARGLKGNGKFRKNLSDSSIYRNPFD